MCRNMLLASNGLAAMSDKVRESRKKYIIFCFIQKLRLLMMDKLLRN